MRVKATVSFAGLHIAMHKGQEADIEEEIAHDLERCGYVATFASAGKEAGAKESKRADKRRNLAASAGNAGGNG